MFDGAQSPRDPGRLDHRIGCAAPAATIVTVASTNRVTVAMSGTVSAGLLLHRTRNGGVEFLLVHPGGPYWRNKDDAAWSIPKGLVEDGEDPWSAALREFAEETGHAIDGPAVSLRPCRSSGGKTIHAWLVEADLDVATVRSNTFALEWPPRSGRVVDFPEIDAAAWFGVDAVLTKIHRGQRPIAIEAMALLA